jgi:hypothetical protein
MSYPLSAVLLLGAGNSGLTLTAALYTSANVAAAGLTTTTLIETDSLTGIYLWTGTVPDGHRGLIKFSAGGVVKTAISVNPQEVENPDVKTSSLTSLPAVATVAATVSGTALTLRRGETLAIPLTGLGNLTGRTKLYFTLKGQDKDTDAQAVIQIEETAGLLRLNGAAATAGQGSLTVTDVTGGAATVGLTATAAAALPPGSAYLWDVEVVTGTTVRTPVAGTAQVVSDITRATS